MNLAKRLLNNPGLIALTTPEEYWETNMIGLKPSPKATETPLMGLDSFKMANHNPKCQIKHLLLKSAFVQPGFAHFPPTQYWHVMSQGPLFHSTRSMQGIKEALSTGVI